MAISGKDLAGMTNEEIERISGGDKCPKCKNNYDTHHDEMPYMSNGVPVCSDCWFDAIGELIDKHPIGHPGAVGARICGDID